MITANELYWTSGSSGYRRPVAASTRQLRTPEEDLPRGASRQSSSGDVQPSRAIVRRYISFRLANLVRGFP